MCAFSRPSAHPSRSSRRALTLPQRRSAFLGLPHPFLSAFLLLTSLRITWAPAEHRQIKQLPAKTNPREHMDRVELALLTLAEASTTAKHIENDTQGVPGLEQDVRETARSSEEIREITERNLGRSVVSSQNFLPPKRENKKLQQKQKKLEDGGQDTLF